MVKMQMFVMNYGSDNMKRLKRDDMKLLIVASNIVELENLINEYFFSKYYRVDEHLTIHNLSKKASLQGNYYTWYIEFNSMFKVYKVKSGYKFYRYYGV